MKTVYSLCGSALLAGTLAVAPALAQQSGLVNVDISNVRIDIADVLDVDVSQVPVTVQAPIGVAANVCPDVTAAVLAANIADTGSASCNAETTSTGLIRIVQRQL